MPNWAIRDAANEWAQANGVATLPDPETTNCKLAGGANARGSLAGSRWGGWIATLRFVLYGGGEGEGEADRGSMAVLARVASSLANGFSRYAVGRLGMSPSMAVHVFAFGVLTLACVALSCTIMTVEGLVKGLGSSALPSKLLVWPAENLTWWVGIFSIVWLAQGGFVDPIRADLERRRRVRAAR